MNRISFYKSFYDNELKRKDDLDKSINNPILIFTIIFGLISYIYKKLNFDILTKVDFVIIILIIIISLLLCKSVYHIILSYNNGIKGYSYKILGANIELEKYRRELIKYNREQGIIDSESEKQYSESIIEQLVKCADINNELNIRRTFQIYLTKKYLILSLITGFLTSITYILKQIL